MTRAFLAASLSFVMLACSSTDLGSSSSHSHSTPAGAPDARDDTTEVSCTYPPVTNDPRCDTIDYSAPCDGSFSCQWPGRGDAEPNGCFATKACFCTIHPGDDAGADGATVGRWGCVQ